MSKNFLVIGGDMRNYYLYRLLEKKFNVKIIGFEKKLENSDIDFEYIKKADIIIGSIPFCVDNYLFMPFSENKITIYDFISMLNDKQIIIAGVIFDDFKKIAKNRNITVVDILEREELSILNAIPTAEGAIMTAMELMETTIHNQDILVIGYGRIGKVLAKSLQGLGGKVCIATNVHSEIAQAICYGHNQIILSEMENYLNKYNLIINTIPYPYLDKNKLSIINNDCLILDLASKPFGVDYLEAEKRNLKAIKLPGLPGKIFPKTASCYLEKTIIKVLNEMVVLK